MFIKSLILSTTILLCASLTAQNWSWVVPLDGESTESINAIVPTPDGGWVASGSYRATLELEGWSATAEGGTDAYLVAYGPDQDFRWGISAGNIQNDEIDNIAITPEGDIICSGSYWFEITLGDTTLFSTLNLRSLFIARFSSDGLLKWAMNIEGDGLKEIGDLSVLADGRIAMAGFHQRNLQLGDSLITTGTSSDSTFCFTAMLSPSGTLEWVQQGGQKRDTRALAMTLLPDNTIVIGGFINDTTFIAGQALIANSFDRDVFLAAYRDDGQPLWAKKAGGVIDEELFSLSHDEAGNIYATGYMIGVMTLSETLSIQTTNGNTNFFLLKYAPDGTPLFARSLGGSLSQSGEVIAARNGQVVVGGFFVGEVSIDGFQADAGEVPHGFIAGFNDSGNLRWWVQLPADGFANINALAINDNQRVLVGGSFATNAAFDQLDVAFLGNGAAFVAQLWPALTPDEERLLSEDKKIKVYPNPASDTLFFEFRQLADDNPLHVCLYDKQGRLLRCEQTTTSSLQINIEGLPAGAHQWVAWQGTQQLGSGTVIF